MSGDVAVAVRFLAQNGTILRVNGGEIRVRYRCPTSRRKEVLAAIELLKQHKAETISLLQGSGGKIHASTGKWPPTSLQAERKFHTTVARLYPLCGHRVRTPKGKGLLLQVLHERATILLDREQGKPKHEQKVAFFHPREVFPADLM